MGIIAKLFGKPALGNESGAAFKTVAAVEEALRTLAADRRKAQAEISAELANRAELLLIDDSEAQIAALNGLGPRQVRVIASTEEPDRAGDIVVAAGADLTGYRNNPVVLASHDPNAPIGTGKVSVKNSAIEALITFAELGASAKADEWCALVKGGVVGAVSIGFNPKKTEPIKGGGWRFVEWELLEISLVTVPANSSALVIERSHGNKAPLPQATIMSPAERKTLHENKAAKSDPAGLTFINPDRACGVRIG